MNKKNISQLELGIVPRLAYRADNFVLGQEMQNKVNGIISAITNKIAAVFYIVGKMRSGKTHLSVYLAEILALERHNPFLLEGEHFQEFIFARITKENISDKDVFIIDNAENYFCRFRKSDDRNFNSSNFVAFYEIIRNKGASIILLSERLPDNLPCDEHILSRLKSGISFTINDPDENVFDDIIRALTLQRGLKLSPQKIEYLKKRLPREIAKIERYLNRVAKIISIRNEKLNFALLSDAR